jgi:ATP sulfurylase
MSVQVIPLERAWYCFDCEVIANQPTCPKCCTRVLQPVAKWLNREAA